MPDALLVLANGTSYAGRSVGAEGHADGEVVFNTSMTGYQEMLTDPSYAGQLLVLTYPLIGNYGIDPAVEESEAIQPRGLIVREAASFGSHIRSQGDLAPFLRRRGVVAIDEVDTRAITRSIRRHGVMLGTITTNETAAQALLRLRALPPYDDTDWVETVTTPRAYAWAGNPAEPRFQVALLDGGVKRNIMRTLAARGAAITVYPADSSAATLLQSRPDGVVLSPGPGDPRLLDTMVTEASALIGKAPLLGICLGHQVIARALGAGTFKLPFGHRGGNHPVKYLPTGRVTVTAQNHGYAVDPDGLPAVATVNRINLNDNTVEGLSHATEPVVTIQYHSEASPGPLDNTGIFDEFVEAMVTFGGRSP